MRSRVLPLAGLLVTLPALAGQNVWTFTGPYGGHVRRLVVSPARSSRIYAVASSGEYDRSLYRSDDAGRTWLALPAAPSAIFAPDPKDPDVLYTLGHRSTDGGLTWMGLGSPGDGYVFDYAVDSRDPSKHYTSYAACYRSYCYGVLQRSTDGGVSWTDALPGRSTYGFFPGSILVVPSDRPALLVAAQDNPLDPIQMEILRSTDGGATWITVLAEPGWNGTRATIAVDPSNSSVVYVAGAADSGGPGGLLRSTDAGATWTLLSSVPANAVAVDPSTSSVFVARRDGVFQGPELRATGLGAGLTRGGGVDALAFVPGRPVTLLAGVSPYGVLRSADSGARFEPSNQGLAELGVDALALTSTGRIYAAGGVVHRSDDGGRTWTELVSGPAASSFSALAVSSATPERLYAAAPAEGCPPCTDLESTNDGGASWTRLAAPLAQPVDALATDPRAPSTLYVGARDVLKTTDAGATWTTTPLAAGSPFARGLALAPRTRVLYAASDGGFYRSFDGAKTWSGPGAGFSGYGVTSILVDAVDEATLYAGGGFGALLSTDGGLDWAELPLYGNNLAQDPMRPSTLWLSAGNDVLKSVDGGATWFPWGQGLGSAGVVRALLYDPTTLTLHAATTRGLFSRTSLHPAPVATSLSPPADGAGNGAFDLTVHGSGFVEESVVLWNGAPRQTLFLSESELAAHLLESDTAVAGTAVVSVATPAPGGGTSGLLVFSILEALPRPQPTALSPASVTVGSPAFELHVLGSSFTFRSQVLWNGTQRATYFVSERELVMLVGAELLGTPGTVPVAVRTPGGADSAPITFTITAASAERFLPIVLDAPGKGGTRYTTELTLVNRGTTSATLELAYTPADSLGASGGGNVGLVLAAGRQLLIRDALAFLREEGLAIPVEGAQGGSLRVSFDGLSSPRAGSVLARITNPSGAGRAGVAVSGLAPDELFSGTSFVFGLAESAKDRSNLALVNAGREPVLLSLTVMSDDGARAVVPDVSLAPGQWSQIGSVLRLAGFASGWARIDAVGGSARYFAYGVVNDNATGDGSVIAGVSSIDGGSVLPVVVRSPRFQSELIAANPFDHPASGTFVTYLAGAHLFNDRIDVPAFGQRRLPRYGETVASTSPLSPETWAGALEIWGPLFAASRTQTTGGAGAYGVFTSATARLTTGEAWVYGLRNDGEVRSNLALVGSSGAQLQVELYSGDTGALIATLGPYSFPRPDGGEWFQLNGVLEGLGVTHAYARILERNAGAAFLAYGVVNDRGTDDGSVLAMQVEP